jgi:glyoxylase-like metal-dependent hydrolase (beta-lactamase superfamily II)
MTTATRRRRSRRAVERVNDGLHRIRLGGVNAYLLECDDGLVLIDCGVPRRGDLIVAAVAHLGRAAGEIGHILVTHHHPDHTGSLAALARHSGAQIHTHPADAPFIRGDRTWTGSRRDTVAGKVLGPLQRRLGSIQAEPAQIDGMFDDGERLAFAAGAEVLHTPGHTPGHSAFLIPRDGGVLIAGDAATNVGRLRSGGHRLAAMVSDDLNAARTSFRTLAGRQFEVAVFGHGSPIRAGASERFREVAARVARQRKQSRRRRRRATV